MRDHCCNELFRQSVGVWLGIGDQTGWTKEKALGLRTEGLDIKPGSVLLSHGEAPYYHRR